MLSFTDTIAALATPVGVSAIAVLRVSGPDSARLAREIFGETPPPRVARHGDYRARGGELVDDVLFTFFQGPQSYTGEDSVEISCHGNPFIAQKILEDLLARGCRAAGPGEYTKRAFLNGRLDLTQAEAVMDLIHARSNRALAAANDQLRGALGRRMNSLIDGLLNVLARVEAYIDFPEEDLPDEDLDFVARELERLIAETDRLLATSHYGHLLRDGIKTVIVGAPNVGKSSLLNRLVGHDRALVSPEPGTTRDFIEERVIVGPHCLRIIDTAGLNPSPTPLERLGIEKTLERMEEANLFLLVVDVTRPTTLFATDVGAKLLAKPTIVVMNKIDLVENAPRVSSFEQYGNKVVYTSAETGGGMEDLIGAITKQADLFRADAGNEVIAIGARHAHVLSEARASLRCAHKKLVNKEPAELLASELRGVLISYGEIGGKIDNERILDRLFANFCIGK